MSGYQPGEVVDTTAIPDAYVNGDDHPLTLRCSNERCDGFMAFIEAGDRLADLVALARDHECTESDGGETA